MINPARRKWIQKGPELDRGSHRSVLSAAGIIGAALILFVGMLSDRLGRKPFFMIYEAITALSALIMFFTGNSVILAVIILEYAEILLYAIKLSFL